MEKTLFNIDPNKIYKVDEVSKILRMSEQTVTKAIRSGELSAVKLGGHTYRIMGCHFLEYLNKRYVVGDKE